MNGRMILYTIGVLLKVEAALMLLPVTVCLIYGEKPWCFLITMAVLVLVGQVMSFRRPVNESIYPTEGFVIVGLSWILLSLFGALPFVLSGDIPRYVDAFFETVSGFTTTGASILTNVEVLGRGVLFWRSFIHWVGGMGVLVFVLAVLPRSDAQMMHVMRAEVPGPSCGKLVARVRHTALILYGIYLVMTVVLIVLLLFGGMSLYDSMIHAFGTAGTGGFSVRNLSVGYYDSVYIDYVIAVFMLLFGINFNLYFYLLIGDLAGIRKSEELRWYLGIVAAATAIVTIDILPQYGSPLTSLRYAFFQVASIITTTGYATADYGLWPNLSQAILVLLMFIGAMAGSTGGGIKVSRVALLVKDALRETRIMRSPREVRVMKFEGKVVDKSIISGVHAFFTAYILLFVASVVLLSLDGHDHVSNFTAVASCFNNVGPALGVCGPVGNYSTFSDLSKLVLSFDMLAGRLEIFPLLLLFSPRTYLRK